MAFARTTVADMDHISPGELIRDTPQRLQGTSVIVLNYDTEVVA